MSKQTAVEWLVDELLSGKPLMPSLIEQAKQMEKKQIEDAYLIGLIHDWTKVSATQAEQYYHETYGGDNE
jgi:hypothetical protein